MTIIIGLCGPAGAGKSTCAKHLADTYGGTRYAFANPLKRIVGKAFNLTDAQLFGTQAQKEATDERYLVSPRWLLQRIGTEGIRAVLGPDFWWEFCLKQIDKEAPKLAIIEDVRFPNEASGVICHGHQYRRHRSHVWRLETPPGESIADPSHASEASWSQCPFTATLRPAEYGLEFLYSALDELYAHEVLHANQ